MFCPSCGAESSEQLRFCRRCGLELSHVSELLTAQSPLATTNDTEIEKKKKRVEVLATSILSVAAVVFVSSIFYAIITKIIIAKGEVVSGTIFLALLSALIAGGLLLTYSASLQKRKAENKKSDELPSGSTTPLLPDPSFTPAASVTERTTELLRSDEKVR